MRSLVEICLQWLPSTKLMSVLVQLLLATTIFQAHCNRTNAAAISAQASSNLGGFGDADIGAAEKRHWQSLQGAWGKRTWNLGNDLVDGTIPGTGNTESEEIIFPEHWVPLLLANGERYDPQTKYSVIYVADANLNLNGKRPSSTDEDNDLLESVNNALDVGTDGVLDDDTHNGKYKRSWQSLNGAWGKRRTAPTWNKFRGAWGKREPGWNNLKGMWGKRSAQDWQKLHAGWGKRSMN